MDTHLATPTVHMNGTSRDALLDQLFDAINAIHEAGKKLARACPNGRDYYTQGAAALNEALLQHEGRMAKLKSVTDELKEIAEQM